MVVGHETSRMVLLSRLLLGTPEMHTTEALQVDTLSRQDSLRRGRVASGCVLSKEEALVDELRFDRS